MAEAERIVRVRGEGGIVFDVDLAKNPWAEEQLETKKLKLVRPPEPVPEPKTQPKPAKPTGGRSKAKEV